MKKALRTRVAGWGTAMGAVLLGSLVWVGCAPGTLPCDQDDWKKICEGGVSVGTNGGSTGGGSSGGSTGNNGGTTGGGSGGSTTSGGSGGSTGNTGGDMGSKAIADCAMYPTVKDMDRFFDMRCGKGAACHAANSPFGEIKGADAWKSLSAAKSKLSYCNSGPLVDTSDPENSLIWRKVQATPACKDGPPPGARMPSAPEMPLSDAETKCLKGFVTALKK